MVFSLKNAGFPIIAGSSSLENVTVIPGERSAAGGYGSGVIGPDPAGIADAGSFLLAIKNENMNDKMKVAGGDRRDETGMVPIPDDHAPSIR